MRQSWILIVLGLLLIGGAAYVGLHHSHLDIDVGTSGITVAHVRVDCGSPLSRKYPLPAGLQYQGKGPCASSTALARQLTGSALAAAAGVGCLVMGITGLVRRPAAAPSAVSGD
ncbi:hypothetical protein Caci_6787 [Catenulispora acidiphila DSM 44928]|uniref:Uncharacterized protein n=1 Tax=Catenulispora acidiphila (strain DSM 44928 / JCM 14897 / NBRC 102108 / NRRL B-24433 / ID139908) TaxID=479433 RepID=C7Q1S8_CATAD|nr:hypothetical protein [Catenulispora acidiphila]ACU75629.1 hypothetical protein Caci_6787 [Catenulispora acidiphila DSM 44928]